MAKVLQTLPLLAFITLFLMLANRVSSSYTTCFSFPYFEPDEPDLIYQGEAYVPPVTGVVRLTNATKNSVGRVLYSTPVRISDLGSARYASFATTFEFVITYDNDSPGDGGIAFFIAPINTTIPDESSGGYLGLFSPGTATNASANQIIAVEFDTFVDSEWDPSYPHIGIDVNKIRSSEDTKWETVSEQTVTAHISYNADGDPPQLSVHATSGDTNYAVTFDVSLKQYFFSEWVRVGISASTGQKVAIHDVNSWSFNSSLVLYQVNKEDVYQSL